MKLNLNRIKSFKTFSFKYFPQVNPLKEQMNKYYIFKRKKKSLHNLKSK